MPIDSDLKPPTVREELIEILGSLKGWPLDKRETLAAFNLMGLTSRLQPLHVESKHHQESVVQLAVKLADMALAELDKE